jgi:hypothetical protein
MVKRRGPPSQGWRTFLRNHAPDIAAMDLFVVPTIGFDLLYAFVIVRLDRRDLVWSGFSTLNANSTRGVGPLLMLRGETCGTGLPNHRTFALHGDVSRAIAARARRVWTK